MAKRSKKASKEATSATPVQSENLTDSIRKAILFLKDDRFRFVMSIAILFFTAFSALAFVSFLFTWKADQSKLDLPWSEFMFNPDINVENWAGKTGASISNFFIYKGFGIASFAFLVIYIVFSFRLVKIRLLPLRKSTKYILLGVIWVSIVLGFLFGDALYFLGGAHGYYVSHWCNAAIGKFGTAFLLLVSLVTFVIFTLIMRSGGHVTKPAHIILKLPVSSLWFKMLCKNQM